MTSLRRLPALAVLLGVMAIGNPGAARTAISRVVTPGAVASAEGAPVPAAPAATAPASTAAASGAGGDLVAEIPALPLLMTTPFGPGGGPLPVPAIGRSGSCSDDGIVRSLGLTDTEAGGVPVGESVVCVAAPGPGGQAGSGRPSPGDAVETVIVTVG